MKLLIKNISQICGCATRENYSRLSSDGPRTPLIEGNSIMTEDGIITDIGINIDADADKIIDAGHCLVTPGFVEAHTHTVFGGTREDEFEMRARSADYKTIAKSGGGILSTVRATRETDADQLFRKAKQHINDMILSGITSMEIKSGYGLDTETEIKQLEVIKRLKKHFNINIRSTFLGAHEIPADMKDKREEYISMITDVMIPLIKMNDLADYIDVFCEKGVYTAEESKRILKAGIDAGMKARIHADEMETSGGSHVAGVLGAKTADHMNIPDINDMKMLAENNTVIVLLPATNFILQIDKMPPIREMRDAGNIIAVSTDFNPGSSPVKSIALAASIGMIRYGLTADELMYAITLNPAYSLDLADRTGSIQVGKDADILIHNIENYRQLFYYFGVNTAKKTIVKGKEYNAQ